MLGEGLWHVREELLVPGTVIEPGRWGQIIMAAGAEHPHFYREYLLELWRRTQTAVPVSRLACAFAYEERDEALEFARGDEGLHVYEVEPADPQDEGFRGDMLWLTWMSEPNSTFDRTVSQCRAYWAGQSTADVSTVAHPAWERLFRQGLRVVSVVE